jgi:hypothetical protein
MAIGMAYSGFQRLPVELLLQVFNYLTTYQDRNSLLSSCRAFYTFLNNELYKLAVGERLFIGQDPQGGVYRYLWFWAVARRNPGTLSRCIDCRSGLDIDAREQPGQNTLLTTALRTAELGAVKVLLERGVDVTASYEMRRRGILQCTIFWLRSESTETRMDAISLFLDFGLDPNAVDISGQTVLHVVAGCGYDDTQLVRLLLDRGADVGAINRQGSTALHIALRPSVPIRTDLISLLLKHGADPMKVDREGLSPLEILKRRSSIYDSTRDIKAAGRLLLTAMAPRSQLLLPTWLKTSLFFSLEGTTRPA